jgi:hypothetical protein
VWVPVNIEGAVNFTIVQCPICIYGSPTIPYPGFQLRTTLLVSPNQGNTVNIF